MPDTPNLALPLLAAAQAQKHITHNEALTALDAIVQCAVHDRDLAAPPASPGDGDRYIVAASPTGAWSGKAGQVAAWQSGGWRFYPPGPGFVAFVADEGLLLVHDGVEWTGLTPGALQNLSSLGIGTAADGVNPFAAKLNAALWTARGVAESGTGDLRYTLNKETSGNVLSFLFQSGYSGRAEIGLVCDDDLQLKTSTDGATWIEAVRVTGDGKVGIGTSMPSERLTVAGDIAPATDSGSSLGTALRRFSTVYAATGTINTSDVRQKRDVARIDPGLALSLVRAAPPISFRWKEAGAPCAEGRHFGWSAQDWAAALEAAGQAAGLVVRPLASAPNDPLGLRPDQITAVLHAAVLGVVGEVEALAARTAALELKLAGK